MPKKTVTHTTKKPVVPKPIAVRIQRLKKLRQRRAHKSFQPTRRRDIPPRPQLPSYLSFTMSVFTFVWKFHRQFGFFLIFYVLVAALLTGLSQQNQYNTVIDTFKDLGPELAQSGIGALGQTFGIFGSTLIGSLNAGLTQIQQLYLGGVYIVAWLTLIWMVRQLVSGNTVRFRDAVYNSCAPLIPTILIIVLILIQLLPGSIGILVFSLAIQNGVLNGGVEAMMLGVAAILLVVLSLYWITSSFFALIIATLPGTYPMAAIRGAGDLALGRRVSLMLRLMWLVFIIVIISAVIIIPVIVFDRLVQMNGLPLIAIFIQVAAGASFVYGVSYIYMLYRRMIDEPAN